MFRVNQTVSLIGKSRHGKAVVKRDGSLWTIERIDDHVLFTSQEGPWLFLTNGTNRRWVHGEDDSDFVIGK